MAESKRNNSMWWWTVGGMVAVCLLGGYLVYRGTFSPPASANEHNPDGEEVHAGLLRVRVSTPMSGGAERIAELPCTVQAYNSQRVYSQVSGKVLQIEDISKLGEVVKKGQKLLVIDVPDLLWTAKRNEAAWKQALVKVEQMKTQVAVAKTEVAAAQAAEFQAKQDAKSADAWVAFRLSQKNRMKALVDQAAIEIRLFEEAKEHYEATVQTQNSARAAIATSRAKREAKEAQVTRADADVKAAKAETEVAEAEFKKSETLVRFATLTAEFDGIVTQRSVWQGDFIHGGTGGSVPLLTFEGIDKFRVVVQIPDQDGQYLNAKTKVYIKLDALPDADFEKEAFYIKLDARAEDPQTRLRRIEIELPNKSGRINSGMYGKAVVVLGGASDDPRTIPATSLVGEPKNNRGQVFVVRQGKAVLVPVEVGTNHGGRIGIRSGLTDQDLVIRRPPSNLVSGTVVEIEVVPNLSSH